MSVSKACNYRILYLIFIPTVEDNSDICLYSSLVPNKKRNKMEQTSTLRMYMHTHTCAHARTHTHTHTHTQNKTFLPMPGTYRVSRNLRE